MQYKTNIYRICVADITAASRSLLLYVLDEYVDQNGRKHNHSLINSKPKQRYFRIELKHT